MTCGIAVSIVVSCKHILDHVHLACRYHMHAWAAWHNTWLLMELMPKGAPVLYLLSYTVPSQSKAKRPKVSGGDLDCCRADTICCGQISCLHVFKSLYQATGSPQCQNWGWQRIKLDGVFVVSTDVGAAAGAAPTLCL